MSLLAYFTKIMRFDFINSICKCQYSLSWFQYILTYKPQTIYADLRLAPSLCSKVQNTILSPFKNLWKNDVIPFSEKSLMYKNIFLSRAIHNILQNPLHTLIWYTVLFTFTYIQAIISLKRKVLTNKKICFIAQHRDIPRNLFSL